MKSERSRTRTLLSQNIPCTITLTLFNLGALTTLQEFKRKKLYQNEVTPICTIHAIFS